MKSTSNLGFISVFYKDILSEFRTRYGISAVTLFILTTIVVLAFSLTSTKMNVELSAGLLWVIMFFSSMTGLSKSFVSEEERQTSLYLKMAVDSTSVYFGKLLFNVVLSISLNIIAVVLFIIFLNPTAIKSPDIFSLTMIFGSIGIAGGTTIISAIIAKANTKGALFPVLSFPIILPLIILGIDLTKDAIAGTTFYLSYKSILLMIAYCGILVTASSMFFEVVWED